METQLDKDEYLKQAKNKAMELYNSGKFIEAAFSMMGSMENHEHYKKVAANMNNLILLAIGQLDVTTIKRYIEGFR